MVSYAYVTNWYQQKSEFESSKSIYCVYSIKQRVAKNSGTRLGIEKSLFGIDMGKEKAPLMIYKGRLNIKMSSYQYMDPHVKDKTVSLPSYYRHGNPIPGKTVFILRRSPGVELGRN